MQGIFSLLGSSAFISRLSTVVFFLADFSVSFASTFRFDYFFFSDHSPPPFSYYLLSTLFVLGTFFTFRVFERARAVSVASARWETGGSPLFSPVEQSKKVVAVEVVVVCSSTSTSPGRCR